MYIKVGRDFVDDCYKKGVVKPNEYRQIIDNIVEEELKLRGELPVIKKIHFLWVKKELSVPETEHFYFANASKDVNSVREAIVNMAYVSPTKLLITSEKVDTLILANNFYNKSRIIRDCSDMFKNRYNQDDSMLVDKKVLWASEYLQKHRQAAYDLLSLLIKDNTII